MLLAVELQAGQLQGAVEPQRAFQTPDLGKALLEVHMGHLGQHTDETQLLPILKQLFAIVVAPTGPAFKSCVVVAEPALKRRPDFAQRLRRIDVGLGDVRQLAAKRRQQRPPHGADEALELVQFASLAVHQGGADFNDFHIRYGPSTLIGGGLQINDQPMRHCRVPGIRVLIALSVANPGGSA
ncbi:hypothetical protein D9M73_190340 [compost metagenome]